MPPVTHEQLQCEGVCHQENKQKIHRDIALALRKISEEISRDAERGAELDEVVTRLVTMATDRVTYDVLDQLIAELLEHCPDMDGWNKVYYYDSY